MHSITDAIYSRASRLKVPVSGTFELTSDCNFRCPMCYIHPEEGNRCRELLPLAEWLRIASEARDMGLLYVLLTGGEPLLYPDFDKLYEELIGMGFVISINTNGSLLREKEAIFLKYPPRKLNISLYGGSEATYRDFCRAGRGTFEDVCESIEEMKKAGIGMKLNVPLVPGTFGDFEEIVSFARKNEIPVSPAPYVFPPVRSGNRRSVRFSPEEAAGARLKAYRMLFGEEKYQGYLKDLLKGAVPMPEPCDGSIRCRAGRATFWVTWEGRLLPCGMMNGPEVELKECGFENAWTRLTEKVGEIRLSAKCGSCENINICHPCAAMAYAEEGDFTKTPEYLCRMAEKMKNIACKTLGEVET